MKINENQVYIIIKHGSTQADYWWTTKIVDYSVLSSVHNNTRHHSQHQDCAHACVEQL